MNIYELSLKAEVALVQVIDFLAYGLRLPKSSIIDEILYWARARGGEPLVGLTVESSSEGFQTFVKWVMADELPAAALLELAHEAAIRFSTEVAVGDPAPTDASIGRFLVVNPDGTFRRAYEKASGGVFDLAAVGPPSDIRNEIRRWTGKT